MVSTTHHIQFISNLEYDGNPDNLEHLDLDDIDLVVHDTDHRSLEAIGVLGVYSPATLFRPEIDMPESNPPTEHFADSGFKKRIVNHTRHGLREIWKQIQDLGVKRVLVVAHPAIIGGLVLNMWEKKLIELDQKDEERICSEVPPPLHGYWVKIQVGDEGTDQSSEFGFTY